MGKKYIIQFHASRHFIKRTYKTIKECRKCGKKILAIIQLIDTGANLDFTYCLDCGINIMEINIKHSEIFLKEQKELFNLFKEKIKLQRALQRL